MKPLIALLTACCCALAFAAQPVEPVEQADVTKPAQKPKNAPKQQIVPQQQRTLPNTKVQKPHIERSTNAVHDNTLRKNGPKKERTVPAVQSNTLNNVQSKKIQTSKSPKLEKKQTAPITNTTTNPPATTTTAPSTTTTAPTTNVQPKNIKVDPATVKNVQAKYANFKAQPKTNVTSVQFNPNYRIAAAQNWTGPQYNAFRTYQPQWHDRGWWSSHYTTLSLIAGGWYFWDAGYWYPAWGYDEAAAYYPYDGPIYVGSNPRPFDQVVADVQAILQEQGYYKGEVDGLVGPLTREALTAYQAAAGLPPTASIDEPTLNSLGLT